MVAAALPLSISVHANQLQAADEICTAALGCAQSDVVEQTVVLVVTGLIAVVILAAVQHVSAARAQVAEERSRTATEQQAFARFARQVAGVDPTRPSVQLAPADGVVTTAAAVGGPPTPDHGLDLVRSAYEETVMSMNHYVEEYDEPLVRNMGHEFGEEVATAVADGGQLTPPLKQALLARAREAAHDRERLMTQLDRESESLDDAHGQLTSLAAAVDEAETRSLDALSFPQLTDEWHRLGEFESRISRLLARRQEALKSNAVTGDHVRRPSLNEYLYGPLDTTFPVLADGAALGERLRATRGQVLSILTNRA